MYVHFNCILLTKFYVLCFVLDCWIKQGPYINVTDANEPPEGQKFQKRNTTEMASNGERLEHLRDSKPEHVSDIVHNHQVCHVACYNHDEKILRSTISKK